MGYARYMIRRNGEQIEAGYDVPTVCEQGGCTEEIDRGLARLCGKEPGGDEHGCGGYYCGQHLYMSLDDEVGDLCGECITIHRRNRAAQDV